jgi:hypothetical protein
MPGQIALPITVGIQPPHRLRPPTGRFHTPVCAIRPCQATSRGKATFTESNLPARRSAIISCAPHYFS